MLHRKRSAAFVCACIGLIAVFILQTAARATIPSAALMKTASTYDSTKFVFPSGSIYVLDPNTANPTDHAAAIQAAIDAVKNASLTKGYAIFIKPGTYYLKRPLIIRGIGVTLVGLRNVQSDGTWGPYPTFQYGDDFSDSDYTNRANIQSGTVDVLEYPAVIRINGNDDYSSTCTYRYTGLRGFNIQYTGTSLTSDGSKATVIALNAADHSPVQDITITGSTYGPYNGIDSAQSMMPLCHNITITNLRGDFGIRAGDDGLVCQAQKFHGVTITAPQSSSSTTDLVKFRDEGELIGARLTGGRIGVNVYGPGSADDQRAGNVTLRSVLIQNTAQQGIKIDNAQALTFTDVQIDYPGYEGIKVCSGFLGGLQILNLRINHAGYSAIRVARGLNISIADAELLNSGQNKSSASSDDLPIAGVFLDKAVTSFSFASGRIGYSDSDPPPTGKGEDWGFYWKESGTDPWHTPQVLASNVNFFANLPTSVRTNTRTSPLPTLTIYNQAEHYTLYNAGFFPKPGSSRPLLEDTWDIQKLATDPEFSDDWLKPDKGYNWYDLEEIRDKQWIDITSTAFSPRIVDASSNISASAFATLVSDAATAYPNGVVFYIPSGKFTNLNTTSPTFSRKIFNIPSGGAGLVINQPKIQLLGSGRDVTRIYIPHQTTDSTLPPRADVLKFSSGSTGSGVYGVSFFYDSSAYLTPSSWANVSYGASVKVDNTSQVRVVNIDSNYGMGSSVAVVDSYNCELYQVDANVAVNNGQPTTPLAALRITGTTSGATHDIRVYQMTGGGLSNVYYNSTFYGWNDANDILTYSQLPELDHVRIEGGVDKVRLDYSTVIEGKNALTVTSYNSLTPSNISSCRFSSDHVQKAFNLLKMTNGDFLHCWTCACYMVIDIASDCTTTGNIRFANMALRGGNLEGLCVRGGYTVDLINMQVGRTCNTTTLNPRETRPLAGIYIGNSVSSEVNMIGGLSGWLWYRLTGVTTNGNAQDWGIVFGSSFASSRLHLYAVQLYQNGGANAKNPASPAGYHRGLGQQSTSPTTSATWITDASQYNY